MKTPKRHQNSWLQKRKRQNTARRLNFLTGLIMAMTAVLLAFNWRTPLVDNTTPQELVLSPIDEDFIQVAVKEKKEMPEPEKTKKEPSVEAPVTEKNTEKSITNKIEVRKDAGDDVDFSKFELPDLPEEVVESNEPFLMVEEFPAFKGCNDLLTTEERKSCTDYELLRFIKDNLKYPQKAIDVGAQGLVHVSFVVETDGSIGEVVLLKGVENSKELNKEAMRLVKSFPEFTPGRQQGRKVRVRMTIPINFKLM